MTLPPDKLSKAPFPYFGGKRDAAPLVWKALGDVEHYAEPFGGTLAVLLLRPHPANRTYYSETVGDADGLLVNFWRSVALSPDATSEAASWPVSEADLHARHLALLKWVQEGNVERLCADPLFHDPIAAGWWAWGASCWIGSGWCSGRGPWVVGSDGRITKRTGARGVSRQIPHLSHNGMGVNNSGLREPGVARQIPYLSGEGSGVCAPQLREPGVSDDEAEFHPMAMPELRRWFQFLSARLRHVRILCGSWEALCTMGAIKNLGVRGGGTAAPGHAGIFLDPPYAGEVRQGDLYAHDSSDVASRVRAWCLEHGGDPQLRIVLAGFAGEGHEVLEERGWKVKPWYRAGFFKGGYALQAGDGGQQDRERLWLSPHCLDSERQLGLFGGV